MLTLDIQEKYLLPIIAGDKTFEIREQRNRNFHVGQYICLKHTSVESDKNIVINTMLVIRIKYITDYAQKPDHVVFSFDIVGDVMTEVEKIRWNYFITIYVWKWSIIIILRKIWRCGINYLSWKRSYLNGCKTIWVSERGYWKFWE